MELKTNGLVGKLDKVGVDVLDNIDLSVVIYGLHYQPDGYL